MNMVKVGCLVICVDNVLDVMCDIVIYNEVKE